MSDMTTANILVETLIGAPEQPAALVLRSYIQRDGEGCQVEVDGEIVYRSGLRSPGFWKAFRIGGKRVVIRALILRGLYERYDIRARNFSVRKVIWVRGLFESTLKRVTVPYRRP